MDPLTKGLSFNILKAYLLKNFGDDAITKILPELNEEDRKVISRTTVSSSWQPEKTFVNLLAAADKVLGKGDYKLCYDSGIYSAHVGIARFFKVFIRFGNPAFVLSRAPAFWKQVHNHGRIETTETEPGCAIARLYDYGTPSKAFCRHLAGYFVGTFEMCGAKNITIREVKCVNDGADHCEFIGKWG